MVAWKMRTAFGCIGLLLLGTVVSARAPQAPTDPKAEAPTGHRLAWSDWADLTTQPYATHLFALCDGELRTRPRFEGGAEVGATLSFAFPRPVTVTAVRFVQGGASKYQLRGDQDGDGTYEMELATVDGGKVAAGKWQTTPVSKKLRGIQFIALAGKARYRASYPDLSEFEIYTAEDVAPVHPPVRDSGRELTLGAASDFPTFTKKKIDNIVCTDLWMAGIYPDRKIYPKGELKDGKIFREMVGRLRDVDADSVRIFLESVASSNQSCWNSKLCNDVGRNALKEYIDALHAEGFRTNLFSHAWFSPFQKADQMAPMPWKRWDYPYEQSDRFLGNKDLEKYYKVRYPCIVSEHQFRDNWLGLLQEFAANGADALMLMPDEYYFKGHNLPKTHCPACQREFKKRFGYDTLPAAPEDTEKYRKWKLFEYEKIAEVFANCSRELKKAHPDITLVSCANQASVQNFNTRLEHGVAMDILSRDPNVDQIQVYGSSTVELGGNTAFVRRFAGAFGEDKLRGSLQWLGISVHEAHDPIKLCGYLLPYVMHGARAIESYRLDYMHATGPWWTTAIHGFKMMRLLEQWDIDKARSVAETCLLISRASEDWWEVRMEGLLGGKNLDTGRGYVLYAGDEDLGSTLKADADTRQRELNYERFRGMAADKCMEGLLVENGVEYDLRYTDLPKTLDDLRKYKLLILPFSYSMSKAAFAAIKAAVDAGSKLLVYDQMAPTDEYGTAYPHPLLQELLKHPNVTYVKTNLAREGMGRSVRAENARRIRALLGDDGFPFDNNGRRVVRLIRRVDDRDYILYLANWSNQPANPLVGLPLPAGTYRLTACSSAEPGVNEALINGKATASAAALKTFNVALRPREVMLLHVQEAR